MASVSRGAWQELQLPLLLLLAARAAAQPLVEADLQATGTATTVCSWRGLLLTVGLS
jgi:hypothetical protein